MGKHTSHDLATVARQYIDEALKIQGNARLSDEDYEGAVARAEVVFRQLAATRRRAARREPVLAE